MLILNGVYKSFGDAKVLNGINLRLERGLVYTLKGGNGSGKTTLINIISGFIEPTQGIVEFKGKKITKFVPYWVNRLGIGRTFQNLRLATQMTAYENVLLALEKKPFLYHTNEQKKCADEILKVSMVEKEKELVGKISYGQQELLTAINIHPEFFVISQKNILS
ncbi:hypothetical protein FACS189411_07240 [Bacteroidia bacterium]|nr:hypothetical protein FACS189411_07240 [Bacteroidia bacterium]